MPSLEESLVAELEDFAALHELVAHHGGRLSGNAPSGLRGLITRFKGPHPDGGSIVVTEEFVGRLHDTLFLAALSICQGVWRSAWEDQGEMADAQLHELTYKLLLLDEFVLVRRALGSMGVFREEMSEFFRLVNVINLAQAHKWLGDREGCLRVLAGESWVAHSPPFQLSAAVLEDRWRAADYLMDVCVQDGLLTQAAFESWPVFREFRERDEYQSAFKRAFLV